MPDALLSRNTFCPRPYCIRYRLHDIVDLPIFSFCATSSVADRVISSCTRDELRFEDIVFVPCVLFGDALVRSLRPNLAIAASAETVETGSALFALNSVLFVAICDCCVDTRSS